MDNAIPQPAKFLTLDQAVVVNKSHKPLFTFFMTLVWWFPRGFRGFFSTRLFRRRKVCSRVFAGQDCREIREFQS